MKPKNNFVIISQIRKYFLTEKELKVKFGKKAETIFLFFKKWRKRSYVFRLKNKGYIVFRNLNGYTVETVERGL